MLIEQEKDSRNRKMKTVYKVTVKERATMRTVDEQVFDDEDEAEVFLECHKWNFDTSVQEQQLLTEE